MLTLSFTNNSVVNFTVNYFKSALFFFHTMRSSTEQREIMVEFVLCLYGNRSNIVQKNKFTEYYEKYWFSLMPASGCTDHT
jgi:hypothetical protein